MDGKDMGDHDDDMHMGGDMDGKDMGDHDDMDMGNYLPEGCIGSVPSGDFSCFPPCQDPQQCCGGTCYDVQLSACEGEQIADSCFGVAPWGDYSCIVEGLICGNGESCCDNQCLCERS